MHSALAVRCEALVLSAGGFEVISEHRGNLECWSEDDPKGFEDARLCARGQCVYCYVFYYGC